MRILKDDCPRQIFKGHALPTLALDSCSSVCSAEVPVRHLRAMAQQMATMLSQTNVAHAGLIKGECCRGPKLAHYHPQICRWDDNTSHQISCPLHTLRPTLIASCKCQHELPGAPRIMILNGVGGSPKVSFVAPRMSGAQRSRRATPRPLNAASSGARPSGDPTFELMAAEKRWEESVRISMR